jgi:hypothetical protein
MGPAPHQRRPAAHPPELATQAQRRDWQHVAVPPFKVSFDPKIRPTLEILRSTGRRRR